MNKFIFGFLFLISTISLAQGYNGCLLLAVNAAQRIQFSQTGQVPGFQPGCLVQEIDDQTMYYWNGGSYEPIASTAGIGGVSSINSVTGPVSLVAGSNITITPSGQDITISSTGGGGGANQSLSNLTSPTALNQDLIFNESGNAQILTADSSSGPSANLNMLTGNGIGQNSGSFSIGAGNSDTENGGVVEFSGGNVTTATANQSNGGQVSIFAGNTASTNINAEGGSVFIAAGNAPILGNSGGVAIYDGNGLGGINIGPNLGVNILDNAGVQGILIASTDRELDDSTGSPAVNFTSNLILTRASPNLIQWQDGSQGTSGQCLVSTDTTGSGSWATCPGGGGGVPAGSNGNIQFNNSGAFGANTLLQWDNTNNNLGINQATPLARIHANSGTTSGSVGADAMILGKPDPTNNIGQGAFIEGGSNGTGNIASAQDAHAEGSRTQATSPSSHVEGFENGASANYSHAEGYGSFTSGTAAHAEGESNANGNFSHSENSATANNASSHAEGSGQTNGNNAHAEGSGTNASGFSSHAEGQNTTASGTDSHSAGAGTTAQSDHQTAVGLYNTPVGTSGSPAATDEIFTVGNGASSGSTNSAFSIRRNGHLKSNQVTAPTTTVQSSAGTGASCAVSDATDSMGAVSITTGTVGASTGSYCNVNFNSSYSVAPICVLTPVTSNAATIVGPYVTSSTTAMTVNFAAAGGISTTYTLNYYCIETQ